MDITDRYIAQTVYGWTKQEIEQAKDKDHQLCLGETHRHTMWRSNQIHETPNGSPSVIGGITKAHMHNHIMTHNVHTRDYKYSYMLSTIYISFVLN